MKNNYLFQLVGVSLCFIYLHACTNSNALGNGQASEKPVKNSISFKVNGQQVKTSGWNISRFKTGESLHVNITSNMHEDKRTVAFNLQGCQPGNYTLDEARGEGTAYGSYKPDYTDFSEAYIFKHGEINISSLDTVHGILNATFHGTAEHGGRSIVITDGLIQDGKIAPGLINY